jgi:enoyl-CoA hydratase/carnithine racemase
LITHLKYKFTINCIEQFILQKMHMQIRTGHTIDAAEAKRIFLVNRVVPDGTEEAEALTIARGIAARSSAAVRIGKRAVRAQAGRGLADAYATASAAMVENLLCRDAAEGIGAFLSKRAPIWEDR